jgi:hypothetical protein
MSKVRDLQYFGEARYDPVKVPANILCFAKVAKILKVWYQQDEDYFGVVLPDGRVLRFENCGDVYVCDASWLIGETALQGAKVTTVAKNEAKNTKREIAAAKEARELSRRLGYPSDKDLVKLMSTGAILNCPTKRADVVRANAVYGPDVAVLKGKTREMKSARAVVEHVARPVAVEQKLSIDLIFIEKSIYLLSVPKPLGYTMVN